MFLEEGKELGRKLEQENTLREKNRADTEKNRADTEKNRADTEKNRADTEKNRADAEKHRAEEERQRADAAVEEIEKLRRQLEELQKVAGAWLLYIKTAENVEIDFVLRICYRNHIRIWEVMQDKWQVRQKVYYGEVCD